MHVFVHSIGHTLCCRTAIMHSTSFPRSAASTVRCQRLCNTIHSVVPARPRAMSSRTDQAVAAASAVAPAPAAQQNGSMHPHGQAQNPLIPLPEVVGSRVAAVKRQTKETIVEVRLNIDGTGQCIANTPVGFFNHMLDQIASHGLFDIYVNAQVTTWPLSSPGSSNGDWGTVFALLWQQ